MSWTMDEDITQSLQSLGNKAKGATNKSLRAGAALFAESLKKQTPYETTADRSWKAQREMDKITGKKTVFKHMRDDIVMSGVDQYGHINVGFGKDTYWRVHFVGLGTVNQRANPFISSAVSNSSSAYQAVVTESLRKELGL
ncbi:MAG: HK97-gp10 family putative phage morphogenesis protein [Lentilactobacillus diolivorans]